MCRRDFECGSLRSGVNFFGASFVVMFMVLLLWLLFFNYPLMFSGKPTPIKSTCGKFSDNDVPLKSAVINVVIGYKFLKLDCLIDSFSVSSMD